MRFILTTARKDLRRRLADPTTLLIWIGLPMLLGGLISALDSEGPPLRAHLLLVDQDNSVVSQLAVAAAGQAGNVLQIEEVRLEDGRRRIAAGEASALLIIPKGFQDGVIDEKPTTLTLVTNPAQQISPAMIEDGLEMGAQAAFYAQRLLGGSIREIAARAAQGTAPTGDFIGSVWQRTRDDLARVQTTLLPPVIGLQSTTGTDQSAPRSIWPLLVPGLLLMSVLFMAQGMSADVWVEKEGGTLGRALASPHPASAFLAGKLATAVALMAMVSAIAVTAGVFAFDVPPLRTPLVVAWTCYTGGALFCYFLLLQFLATSARGGDLLTQMVVFPLMMIGGSVFPFDLMPAWMTRIGQWTPNGLAVTHAKALLFGQPDPQAIGVAALAIGIPAACAFALGVRLLRGRFAVS